MGNDNYVSLRKGLINPSVSICCRFSIRENPQIYSQIHDSEDGVSNDHLCLAGGMCGDSPYRYPPPPRAVFSEQVLGGFITGMIIRVDGESIS